MKTYSDDIRQKIIQSYINREGSYRELARRFSVSLSFVQTLIHRFQDTGTVDPLPHRGGKKAKINDSHTHILNKLIAENNNATIEELCELFYIKTQTKVSESTMRRGLRKLGLTRKNNFSDT
ncbi:MAG: transposase [Calothrix sp. MO_167.B42]|nr:transposase [Calothrix sp. MO_167.B42]